MSRAVSSVRRCLGTGIAFATFVALVGRIGPTRASSTAHLMPLVAMVLGIAVGGETIGPAGIVGTILILSGATTGLPTMFPKD